MGVDPGGGQDTNLASFQKKLQDTEKSLDIVRSATAFSSNLRTTGFTQVSLY